MGWSGRLFEAGRLLTFSAFRMDAYSRWALIRGWVLIRINTVACEDSRLSSLQAVLAPRSRRSLGKVETTLSGEKRGQTAVFVGYG